MTDISRQLREIEDIARKGHEADALGRLDSLAKNHPKHANICASRAYVSGRQGDQRAAVADWSNAIALNDREPHYFYMRGIDLFKLGDYRDAVADFSKVIELCNHFGTDYYRAPAYFFRADAYLRLREFEKAKSDCLHLPDNMETRTDRLRRKADILKECNAM